MGIPFVGNNSHDLDAREEKGLFVRRSEEIMAFLDLQQHFWWERAPTPIHWAPPSQAQLGSRWAAQEKSSSSQPCSFPQLLRVGWTQKQLNSPLPTSRSVSEIYRGKGREERGRDHERSVRWEPIWNHQCSASKRPVVYTVLATRPDRPPPNTTEDPKTHHSPDPPVDVTGGRVLPEDSKLPIPAPHVDTLVHTSTPPLLEPRGEDHRKWLHCLGGRSAHVAAATLSHRPAVRPCLQGCGAVVCVRRKLYRVLPQTGEFGRERLEGFEKQSCGRTGDRCDKGFPKHGHYLDTSMHI